MPRRSLLRWLRRKMKLRLSLILKRKKQSLSWRTGGQEDRRTGGQEDRRTGGQEDRRTGGQENRITGGQEDRRAGGQETRRTGEQVDRRTGGQEDRREKRRRGKKRKKGDQEGYCIMPLPVLSLSVLAARVVVERRLDYSNYITGRARGELEALGRLEGTYREGTMDVTA